MPKTTARCLSLLLEDEAMVSAADAVARASIDAGDQRQLSDSDLFPYCCPATPAAAAATIIIPEPPPYDDLQTSLPALDLDDAAADDTDDAKDGSVTVDINNNNTCERSETEEEREEQSLRLSVESEDTTADQSEAELLEAKRRSRQGRDILLWLEQRLKFGFTGAETAAFVREMDYEEEEAVFEEGVCRIFDPYYYLELGDIQCVEGRRDKKGYPTDKALVTLRNGDELYGTWIKGTRQGFGTTCGSNIAKYGIHSIQGHYQDGVLHGPGRGRLTNGLTFQGRFNNGFLEGPVVLQLEEDFEYGKRDYLERTGNAALDSLGLPRCLVGVYERGVPQGPCWLGMEGGAWIHGQVDSRGQMTGDDIMYLYPGLQICLVGRFQNGIMEEARSSTVQTTYLSGPILVAVAAPPPATPAAATTAAMTFRFSPATSRAMSVPPLQEDPYERTKVEVGSSAISGAGDGLFTKADTEAAEILSFYHGLYYKLGERSSNTNFDYQIFLDWVRAPKSAYLDIPLELTDVDHYTASLGHKVNHSFQPNCEYVPFYHPTFGSQVLAVRSLRQLARGEELTCNYRYDVDDAPDWFVNMLDYHR